MPVSVNNVVIAGNLTRTPELKRTPGGTAVCDLGIAINEKRKSQDGSFVEKVVFVEVACWRRTAETAAEHLSKGDPVLVEGKLDLDTWETDGKKHSRLKVICHRMQMLGAPKQSKPEPVDPLERESKPRSVPYNDEDEQEIPF